MARVRTLQDLLADVRWTADVEGATLRHTDKKITRALNQSIQAFRLMLCEHDDTYYLTKATGTITAGSDTLSLPADFVAAFGLDVEVNGEWRELSQYSLIDRNKYEDGGDENGIPTAFHLRSGSLDFIPKADASYSYRLWYLPTGTDLTGTFNAAEALTASSSEFDGLAGWEDWIVYDTALRISTRDAGTNDNFELVQAELARIQARILSGSRKRVRSGPKRRLDTRGRRLAVESTNRWRLP